MKIGIRTPSLSKSIKARTTGKAKRTLKKAVNPTYGKKGAGWASNPKKAAYNKVYNKTTVGVSDVLKSSGSSSSSKAPSRNTNHAPSENQKLLKEAAEIKDNLKRYKQLFKEIKKCESTVSKTSNARIFLDACNSYRDKMIELSELADKYDLDNVIEGDVDDIPNQIERLTTVFIDNQFNKFADNIKKGGSERKMRTQCELFAVKFKDVEGRLSDSNIAYYKSKYEELLKLVDVNFNAKWTFKE